MFETGYFDVSPFGQGDITANSSKLLDGKNFYYNNSQGLNQNNPWVLDQSTAQQQGQMVNYSGEQGTWQQFDPNKDWTQDYTSIGAGTNPGLSGEVFKFSDGRYVPVDFLYGYDKFGLGKQNRDTLYNMVGWDQWKGVSGIKSPDEIASELWLQHYNTNKHGYTDDYESSSGATILSQVANNFMNQDYFKNQRQSPEQFDIRNAPNWDAFTQQDANMMGTAKAATQSMNKGDGAIISPGLQQFIKTSVMAWLGTGGWGTIGNAIGGAGEGAAAASVADGTTTATASGGTGMDGWADFEIPADQFSSSGLEQYDWGGGADFAGGGNTGYLGSTPYDSAGNWASGMGGGNNWMQMANQGMRAWNGMQGGGGAQGQGQQSGNYSMNLGGLLQGLLGMYGARQNANQMNGMMDRATQSADPFGPQRGFYADQLKQSYQNPQQMWDSPQWQSLRKRMMEDSTAKDAAGGRLTDFAHRDERLASYFMGDYLPKMQQGLQGPAGANGNPAAVAQALQAMSGNVANANAGQNNALGYLLSNLFQGQQPSTLDKVFRGAPAQNDNLFDMLFKMWGSGGSSNVPYTDYQ